MSGEDKKPDVRQSTHVILKVKDQNENVVHFKIKKNVKLDKLIKGYCDKTGVVLETVAFLYDGTNVKGHHTPEELGMEDGDEIDVFLHQFGGGGVF